jgi:hypothetical protein
LAQIWRPSPKKLNTPGAGTLLFNLAPPFLTKGAEKVNGPVGGAFYGYGAHWNLELRVRAFFPGQFRPSLTQLKY